MASPNYIIVDVVQHIHDERQYRASRGVGGSLRRGVWVFALLLVVSATGGALAVFLPGAVADAASSTIGAAAVRSRIDNMTVDQKKQLARELGVLK